MTTDTAALNRATRAAALAVDAILNVHGAALDAQAASETLDPATVMPLIREANDAVQQTHRLLIAEGGKSPLLDGTSAPKSDPFDLSTLTALDTPDARELLDLLTRAQAVAERVDAGRGRTVAADVPLLDGESRGTDLAESISYLALRVRRDVEGAKGRE